MDITDAETDAIIKAVCPYCRMGNPVRFRAETGEYVHDIAVSASIVENVIKGGFSHSICWANGFRKMLPSKGE